MKKWKCTVCGYFHEGAEAPDICPVCKAEKEKFIEITEDSGNTAITESVKNRGETEKVYHLTTQEVLWQNKLKSAA